MTIRELFMKRYKRAMWGRAIPNTRTSRSQRDESFSPKNLHIQSCHAMFEKTPVHSSGTNTLRLE